VEHGAQAPVTLSGAVTTQVTWVVVTFTAASGVIGLCAWWIVKE
jgi:hypothetical protein